METAAQYALDLCQQMATTKLPNTGDYGPAIQGAFGLIGVANAGLIVGWWQYSQWAPNYGAEPSWDVTNTPASSTGLPHPFATAASILMIEFLIHSGQMTLDAIAKEITNDPYLVMNDLYTGTDLQTDAVDAMLAGGAPTNNDPLNVFDVNWGSS